MSASALTMLLISEGIIVAFTVYFFAKVMRTPKRPKPDSYSENDDEVR